jgi:hypothetical protein
VLTAAEQPRVGARWVNAHGMANTPEYKAWEDMKQRCADPRKYPYHAGKGIAVCPEWAESFESFFSYIGLRPSPFHSLDRFPNREGNYEPNNVRWATISEQNSNTSRNVYLEHDGLRMTIAQWTRHLGWERGRIQGRLKKGWSVADTLTRPLPQRGKCTLCEKPMNARGLCGAHYSHWRAGRLSVPTAI